MGAPLLWGVYGGYYRLAQVPFSEQIMGDVWPHDARVWSWDLAVALTEMQEYQALGYDYVTLTGLTMAQWEAVEGR
jgi:hypothetical protein